MFHTVAYYQSVNPAGALVPIAAVADQAITVAGNDVRIPTGVSNLVGSAGLIADASAARMQLQSPSLRANLNFDREPLYTAKAAPANLAPYIQADSPIPLVPNEALNCYMQSAPAGAVIHYGLAWLSDGPVQPVKGTMFSVRATSAIGLVAGQWVNGPLVFAQTIPEGTWQIVGMRARGVNLTAARLVFVGGTFRPGILATNVITGSAWDFARYGNLGVFGQFDPIQPPTVDCLGDTDASQTYIFDMMRVK